MAVEEQIVSNDGAIMEAVKLILAGGVGAAIVGGFLTVVEKIVLDKKLALLQAKHDKQLEALKSQLKKKNVIHKLQFEMEFQVYRDFWKALVDVKRTASITPILDMMPAGKKPLDVYKERWTEAAEKFQKALDLLDYNRPFYHDDVSEPATELLDKCRKHLIKLQITLQRGERKGVDIHEEDEKLSKMIIEVVDKIKIVIKKRIGLLQETELVE